MKPQKPKTYQNNKHFNKPKSFDGPPPFDVLLRQFKKKCERKGIVQEVRDRQFYEKPAQAKQRKMKEAVRRERMIQSAINPYMGRQKKY
ncbi:30S ribosomal protein S21 [bacterium]|jgi:ribosomal protein S21|nr:30S ribosomal protein S21 [bacterium]|tara:strand:+ start:692 stop:958 length:267 start_codon:yes stop_codon:yes gene_type:complete